MIELFAYGTLRDAEYQEALFGAPVAMRPATLADWMPVTTESGYLTIVEAPGESVSGALLALDAAALAIADAWEEVPLYVRVSVDVTDQRGALVAAAVYVRPSESRERAPAGILALHERDTVLAQIRRFRATNE